MGGPPVVSWQDIESYCRLTGREFDPWEIKAIRAMDSSIRGEIHRQAEAAKASKGR
jgi:hypothetical protein